MAGGVTGGQAGNAKALKKTAAEKTQKPAPLHEADAQAKAVDAYRYGTNPPAKIRNWYPPPYTPSNLRWQIFQGKLQRAIGYSLTGLTSEQCLFFLFGTGSNGKSTFTKFLEGLLGAYALKSASSLYTLAQNGRK